MKRFVASLAVMLIAAASCASPVPEPVPQTSAEVQTQTPAPLPAPAPEPIPAPVVDAAAVTAAFYAAEATAALFTGYVGNVFADGSVEADGIRYDRFALSDTMAALEARVHASFDEALAAELLAVKTPEGYPLYIERDGALYRFGGNIAQFEYRDSAAEVINVREEGGVILVDVAATFDIMDDPLTVTHTYTCVETAGEYRFTGEFLLPFTVVYDAWIGRNMK